jgi:serine/threonine-protein kinase
MPPVPGTPPQPAQPPGPGPEDPHPWQNQLRAARDRNEQTQVQPLDPNLDPLRRRPTRQQSPQHQAPPPAPRRQAAPPPPEHYGHGRPQHRPAQPPPRRYEEPPRRRREPEPPRRREPEPRQRSANPMHIPGLGCLKGCLFMIVLLVVAAVLIWNLTPLPEWWEQGKDFWDSVTKTFDEISNLVDSAPQDPQGQ